ncbi:low affinity iron permease family protein [Flavobacterium crocinum]|uniref:Low affinity iron permease family protein n=1 Tax=Flavobacterium crocinum TaxID=2183896 RepID=A0A2S1YRC6_9FLAO|nr:low affinity iron permease family protein [Flavobacterium crocinum]AWK06621.1 low affinity iron permease family protein [Flavobacterium crocinum]
MKSEAQHHHNSFEKFATKVSKAAGSTTAFIGAFIIVVAWAVSGPIFDYSETWQLVINTGTTIITFLMVFLIQKAQNKDSLAIQLKLNELVASSESSSNSLVDIESMTEEEMIIIQKYYHRLSELAKKDESIRTSHSIAEAHELHNRKQQKRNKPATKKNIKDNTKNTTKNTPKNNTKK